MAVNIDTDAEITSIRLDEQVSAPTPDTGYSHIFAKADGLYVVDDDDVVTGPLSAFLDSSVCNGRLTLETGVPVSTADQSAKTTLYFTPYKGEKIGLYDGTAAWDIVTFSEISITMVGLTASKPYDVFVYNSSGTATLEVLVWTNDTTRATALTTQDGIYVKTGATTRRYVGTIRINGTGGQVEDTVLFRGVWNYYNRTNKHMQVSDDTDHTYTTSTWRSWNNDATIRYEFVVGVVEDSFIGTHVHQMIVSSTSQLAIGGACLNATTSTTFGSARLGLGSASVTLGGLGGVGTQYSREGYNYVQATEYGYDPSLTFDSVTLYGAILA